MAHINTLKISHFRNIHHAELHFSPGFNVICGDNGAGKTSLLESLYYLALAKSFRQTAAHQLIQHQQHEFLLLVEIGDGDASYVAGCSYHQNRSRQTKLNGESLDTVAAIARIMPLQFMSPMSYRFFHDGPKIRRQYLDWALFHVEPRFFDVWRAFQRVLRQRNSALKQQSSTAPWDVEFVEMAAQLDEWRQGIVEQLRPICLAQLRHLLPDYRFDIHYQRGWDEAIPLDQVLSKSRYRDQQLGYTACGPQRADLQLLLEERPIQHVLSQGQQKLAAYALHLSLGTLLNDCLQTSPIYLIDDLPSELDARSRTRVIGVLADLGAQTFITGIASQDLELLLAEHSARMFHVEQGKVSFN